MYFLGTLYVIQGLLLLFGAFLAWETKKVKYKINIDRNMFYGNTQGYDNYMHVYVSKKIILSHYIYFVNTF